MIQSPELQAKIALWRHRAATGEITIPELIEAMTVLRQSRSAAQAASSASKARAKKAPVDTESLKAGLKGLMKKP